MEQDRLADVVRGALAGELTEARIELAQERLQTTGAFSNVDFRCEEMGGGVDLIWSVRVRPLIRHLVVQGNDILYTEELKKRIFLRPGVRIGLEGDEGEEAIRRQESTLVNYYERAGFMNPSVQVSFTQVGIDEVDCFVKVNEGEQRRIELVEFKLERTLRGDTVPDAELDPQWQCPQLRRRELLRVSGLDSLDVHTERAERASRQKLTEYLQSHGLIEPNVAGEFDAQSGILQITVQYEQCHKIQFLVRSDFESGAEGYRFQEPEGWRDILSFGTSGTFDFDESEYGRRLLESHLEKNGLLFSEIRLDYREVDGREGPPGQRGTPVTGVSTFLVTEGYVTEIRKIDFEGMNHFDADVIRGQLETQKYDFFGEGGYLQVQLFFEELAALQARYREEGFARHRFTGFTPTQGDYVRGKERRGSVDVYSFVSGNIGFRARKPIDENVIYITVQMEEGPRSVLRDLRVSGCGKRCDALRKAMDWENGEAYSRSRLRNGLQRAQDFYESLGHPGVAFELDCEEGVVGASEKCSPETARGQNIRLHLKVNPGPVVRVGEVFLSGHFKTNKTIVLRDLPQKGDLLRLGEIRKSERSLRNLGVFNTVSVGTGKVDVERAEDEVPLHVSMEEASSRFLDFAVGFESLNRVELGTGETGKMPPVVSSVISNSIEGENKARHNQGHPVPFEIPDLLLVFQTEYLDTNLFGNAQELRLPVKYGLSTTDPLRVVAGAPTWIERRFLGTELIFRQTLYGLYDKARNPFDLLDFGSQSEISVALGERAFLSARYNLSANATRPLDVENPKFESPTLINKVSPTVGWQDLDAVTHPTQGFGSTLTTSYIHSIDLGENQASNFVKWLVTAKGYVNARGRIVIANFLRVGGAYSVEGDNLPEIERFRLGGAKGVRGFADGEISQYRPDGKLRDRDPATVEIERIDGGDYTISGTSELRFPFMMDLGPLELWGATFFDWGALSDDIRDFHRRSFRGSTGLGLRLLLYGRVPIRLDYGVKLSPRCSQFSARYETCLEEESSGELDFNLLYTF